jgi:nucleotidyltransferase/DNA polymerase involved in DNA repair
MNDWREHFIKYNKDCDFYIYCDTNASYCSIHQYLEGGLNKPAVVANGNIGERGDAGSCLAISYEARNEGVKRGASLRKARTLVKNLVVYESCLPLYELYADLYDLVLELVCPKDMCYRGSCDEVVIRYQYGQYPYRKFWTAVERTLAYIKEQLKEELCIDITPEQEKHVLSCSPKFQSIYAICYLIRDVVKKIIGLPVSIAVAPSISLSKSLIEISKPSLTEGHKVYSTFHDAICFPHSAMEANCLFKHFELIELCGIRKIATRLARSGIVRVNDVQQRCSLEQAVLLSKNVHLGKVVWYMAHGRDDVLSGYLAAIRDRK